MHRVFQFVEKLVFRKLNRLSRKEAEWRFLRPKAYKSTSMGEKTSNKQNIIFSKRDGTAAVPYNNNGCPMDVPALQFRFCLWFSDFIGSQKPVSSQTDDTGLFLS